MNIYKILIPGYAKVDKDGFFKASPTTTLIYSQGKKVLIDPGSNSALLLEELEKLKLTVDDIDILFLTHYHPDHFLNLKLFPKHDLYDGTMRWSEDKEIPYIVEGIIPETDIKILPTPGHSPEHCSLIIGTKDQGVVCIAQDVFWWEDGDQRSDNYNELLNLHDPFATDMQELIKSRKKVLEIADWIVPGHGKLFKNKFKK